MSTVNQVYLKDENDNIVSPVTSVNSVYDSTGGSIENYIVNLIYPIGSIYMSVNSANPSTLFGGTWEQIQDTFLLSSGDTYTSGETGGEAEHTLTIEEMPVHKHTYNYWGANLATCAIVSGSGICATSDPTSSSTGSKGEGKAHNNMPPYLVVNVWKRTA